MLRILMSLMIFFVCSTAVAETEPPGTDSFNQYLTAYWDGQALSKELLLMATEDSPDKAKAKVVGEKILENKNKAERYLAQSITEGNAAAVFYKARMTEFGDPMNPDLQQKREKACALYGDSARKGLLVGAIVYAKCSDTVPKTPRYDESRMLLRNVLNAEDAYLGYYPFAVSHAYCFERTVEPPKTDEDPFARIRLLGQPTLLEAQQARAEGFYYLAADYSSPVSAQSQQDLQHALEAGCQTDGLRLKKKSQNPKQP